ncbi:hypothetical protein FPANT_8544 [Fusarium pseudoanthophilum]|uniref:F-box domain-containing protein n=1 Tax=Fusarium pseudoanthophilum TaxID=48495 RepID=A0A8H5L266_9HYPO|nr:hypothetical protein FPANT_8544 [Fusarium pseudoanthophilum]
MPSFNSLPLEILAEVGGHLPVQDLGRMSLTSKTVESCLRNHLFRSMWFAGTRTEMADALMQFLKNRNQSRTRGMGRACRHLRLEVRSQDNDQYDEYKDLLPALLTSAKRHLSLTTTLSLSLQGLSKAEVTSLQRMAKENPAWDAVTVLITGLSTPTLSALLRHSLNNVQVIDVLPNMVRHGVASIKDGCPQVRHLRVNFKVPINDFLRHLRGGARVKINQLDHLQQLVVQEKAPADTFPVGGIPQATDIPFRLALIADQLVGMANLRRISLEFHRRIMTWILPLWRLNPGDQLRTDLDDGLMRAIMEMATRLPQVEEICLVEHSFNSATMVHRGVRDSNGVMAVTIEAPGDENDWYN